MNSGWIWTMAAVPHSSFPMCFHPLSLPLHSVRLSAKIPRVILPWLMTGNSRSTCSKDSGLPDNKANSQLSGYHVKYCTDQYYVDGASGRHVFVFCESTHFDGYIGYPLTWQEARAAKVHGTTSSSKTNVTGLVAQRQRHETTIAIGRYKVRDTTLNAHISKGYKVRLIITNGSGDVHDCSDRSFPPKLKDFKW